MSRRRHASYETMLVRRTIEAVVVAFATTLGACGGSSGGEPAAATQPAPTAAPAATTPAPTASASATPAPTTEAPSEPRNDPEPPPLVGKGGTTAEPDTCSRESVQKQLDGFGARCMKKSPSELCGHLGVTKRDDSGNVDVSVELTSGGDTAPFVNCMNGHFSKVSWSCVRTGTELKVELGCDDE